MKELLGIGYVPLSNLNGDASYSYYFSGNTLYGIQSGEEIKETNNWQTIHTFSSGVRIDDVFTTDLPGELFCVHLESLSPNVYTLQRSIDYGSTWETVYSFNDDTRLETRGFVVGYPNGIRTLAFAEYYDGSGASIDQIVATSLDGVSWNQRWSMQGGSSGTRQFRHFHCIVWDRWSECFWIASGDANIHSMIIKWDGISTLPDNTLPADLDSGGQTILHGEQKYRSVDIIPTPDYIYWFSDTTASSDGTVTGDKGIFRANKDLTVVEHLDLGDGRYDPVSGGASRSTGWSGVFVTDDDDDGNGHILFTSSMNEATSGNQFESIFMAHTSSAALNQWAEVGRIYVRSGEVNTVRGFFVDSHQRIYLGFSRGAGKGTQGETSIMKLGDRDFIKDIKAAPTLTDRMLHENYHIPPMHPLFWVSPTGDDSNDGKTPAEPFATFAKALASSTAVITYGTGVVFANGNHEIADSLTLNWFNYPTGSGYEGETDHPVWMIGEGIGRTIITEVATNASSSHICEINNTLGQLMIDSCAIYGELENAGARVFFMDASQARVHSRDAQIGHSDHRATAVRTSSNCASRRQHYRSKLLNGRTAGGTSAVLVMEGSLGDLEELHACLIAGYQCASLGTNGTGIESFNNLFYDYLNLGVGTVSGNTTGKMWLVGCVFVNGGAGTGTSYNSTSSTTLNRFFSGNAYTVLPLQVGDQGINGQVLITEAEFVNSDPRLGLEDSSSIIEQARSSRHERDFNRRVFKNASSTGYLEHNPNQRPSSSSRAQSSR